MIVCPEPAVMRFTTHRIESDGVDLYYQQAGEGPAIVFLHGFGGNHLTWWQQIPAFADDYTCIVPDQRMFGRSTDRSDGPGAAAFVPDLVSLLDGLDIERAALVGQSMSGWTAASFATQHPDRVAALVLSASPGGLLDPDRWNQLREEFEESMPDVDPLSDELSFLSDTIRSHNVGAPPSFQDIYPTLSDFPIDRDGIIDHGIPVFLIAGEADPIFPPPAMAELHDHLDAVGYAIVEDARHSAYFDNPTAYNRHVESFVGESAAF